MKRFILKMMIRDYRFAGNYVTLTNMSDEEIDRLIKMRVSPINVSVQATNPELRCKMLNNRFAGKCYDIMKVCG